MVLVFFWFFNIFGIPQFFGNSRIFAQNSLEECNTKEECEALLKKYENEIAKYEKEISKTKKEKQTLKTQLSELKNKIEKLNFQIRQTGLMIKDMELQIKDTESSIEKTSVEIDKSKEKLANLLQLIYENDQNNLIEVFLAEKKLSDFFGNSIILQSLNVQHQEVLDNVKNLKDSFIQQKEILDEEKEDLEKLSKIKMLQRLDNEKSRSEKEQFLKFTEKEYQKFLNKKTEVQKKATEIKTRLFKLAGVSKAPTFGEAYDIAEYVEKITGVRPAFLLAVLTQESDIGKNVGQCYLKDSSTGKGVVARNGKEVSRVMNPRRDVPYFISICQELNRDPYKTLISCPMSFGWGGAMGPAQFIPSTWQNYKDRIKAVTGKSADPWNIKDAFLAAGFYLSDYGAAKQTKEGEWQAAMIYFSGTTNKKYRFYGDSVVSIASRYTNDIEMLKESSG